MGVRLEPFDGIRDPDLLQQVERPIAGCGSRDLEVGMDAFHDLVTHRKHGIQTGHRILKDHPDAPAADLPQGFSPECEHVHVAQLDGTAWFDSAGRGH
jgi:hypothetical protein